MYDNINDHRYLAFNCACTVSKALCNICSSHCYLDVGAGATTSQEGLKAATLQTSNVVMRGTALMH